MNKQADAVSLEDRIQAVKENQKDMISVAEVEGLVNSMMSSVAVGDKPTATPRRYTGDS